MLLKVTTSITLSTGHSGSATVIQTFQDNIRMDKADFLSEIKAYKTEADMNAGYDHAYPYVGGVPIHNLRYVMPQADLDQVGTDGHFGIIGENHPQRVKDALAAALGVDVSNITILNLI